MVYRILCSVAKVCAAVGAFGDGSSIMVDVYRAAVGSFITVFPVIAYVQGQAVCDKPFIRKLENQGIRHLSDNDPGFIIRVWLRKYLPFGKAVCT